MDITFDFETCALCPTAAVMSISAVAWARNRVDTPFYNEDDEFDADYLYLRHVDLRSQFVNGFTFDQETANWWSSCSTEAKLAVTAPDSQFCESIENVVIDFFTWIKEVACGEEIFLWSQGSDFDIAILRNICHKYHIDIPVSYKNFRDHRTFFSEGAKIILDVTKLPHNVDSVYSLVEPYDDDGVAHDPMFDCKCSIYSTWQMMKHLRSLNVSKEE